MCVCVFGCVGDVDMSVYECDCEASKIRSMLTWLEVDKSTLKGEVLNRSVFTGSPSHVARRLLHHETGTAVAAGVNFCLFSCKILSTFSSSSEERFLLSRSSAVMILPLLVLRLRNNSNDYDIGDDYNEMILILVMITMTLKGAVLDILQ